MLDQETTENSVTDNEIEASIRANRYARAVLDPENSPEIIRKRYLAEAGQYFFRDRNNALAFEDKGARIATRTEDPVVAASMVELAIAKGWKELKAGKRNLDKVPDVADPWYTGNFDDTWRDVTAGCEGLLKFLD